MSNECAALLEQLIRFASITPLDEGCQRWMSEQLKPIGFKVIDLPCAPVDNFYAQIGEEGPLFVFAGHTDVVATGSLAQWHTPPFEPTVIDDMMHGRGAADMKGSLAAMMVAAKKWRANKPNSKARLGFLITSGEEGDQFDHGTPYVMEQLKKRGIHIDYCLVGEPSSTTAVGDVIKVGRRGSLSAQVHVHGVQGHVAYPHLANNPIHQAASAISALCQNHWDDGNDFFPATTFQISNIEAGTGAGNVIPGEMAFKFNFRYSTESTHQGLKTQVESLLKEHQVNYSIKWRLNGEPFLTSKGRLVDAACLAVKKIANRTPTLSTTGGTSDGRFIAPHGVEVIELGPVNATIHQANESTSLSELEHLANMYYEIINELLS